MGDNEWMLHLTDIPPKVRYFSASVPTAAKYFGSSIILCPHLNPEAEPGVL